MNKNELLQQQAAVMTQQLRTIVDGLTALAESANLLIKTAQADDEPQALAAFAVGDTVVIDCIAGHNNTGRVIGVSPQPHGGSVYMVESIGQDGQVLWSKWPENMLSLEPQGQEAGNQDNGQSVTNTLSDLPDEGGVFELLVRNNPDINNEYCPLNLSAIPNYMGINLCAVEKVAWKKQADGQLKWLSILFLPEPAVD